jgi:hypothetical protein
MTASAPRASAQGPGPDRSRTHVAAPERDRKARAIEALSRDATLRMREAARRAAAARAARRRGLPPPATAQHPPGPVNESGARASYPMEVTAPRSADRAPSGGTAVVRVSERARDGTAAAWGDHVLVGWSATAGPRGIGFSYSTDGGRTFRDGDLPPAPPGWAWRGDPVVAVNERTGAFYYCALVDPTPGTTGIAVGSATLTGSTLAWGAPVLARSVDAARAALEQPRLVADSSSGHLYLTCVAFDRRARSHIAFQRSADGGVSWSGAARLSRPTDDGRVRGARPALGPDGKVHVVWTAIGTGPEDMIRLRASADRGATWGTEVAPATTILDAGAGFPAIAVDRTHGPHRGRVHIAWAGTAEPDAEAPGDARDVLATHSDDGGAWSAPVVVNDPASRPGDGPGGMAVAADGLLYLTWLDRRGAATHPVLARSSDGGASWSPGLALSDVGGDDPDSAGARGQLVADGRSLRVLWTAARGADADLYTTRLETGFDLTACQGDLAMVPGSAVHPGWTVTNRNTLFVNAYDWTLTSARGWPLAPAGASAAGAGGTGAILPALAVPDSAAPGVNRMCLAVTDAGGLRTRRCCFDITVERPPASVPVLASPFDLRAGTPDPGTRRTRIDYSLPHAGPATLGIYDLRGERVRTLASGDRPGGPFSITWDGRDDHGGRAGPGAYFCRLEAFGTMKVQRLIWVR